MHNGPSGAVFVNVVRAHFKRKKNISSLVLS